VIAIGGLVLLLGLHYIRDQELISAIYDDDYSRVEALLGQGASPNDADPDLLTTAVHDAATGSDARMLSLLLKHGGDPNVIDWQGVSPLIDATFANCPDSVRLLLSYHADPKVSCSQWGTALDVAATYGYADVAQLLVQNGADPTIRWRGKTAAQIVKANGYREVLDALEHKYHPIQVASARKITVTIGMTSP